MIERLETLKFRRCLRPHLSEPRERLSLATIHCTHLLEHSQDCSRQAAAPKDHRNDRKSRGGAGRPIESIVSSTEGFGGGPTVSALGLARTR